MQIDLWLYGPLARYGGEDQAIYAHQTIELPEGSCVRQLLAQLGLPTSERGITFINGCLTALPGVQPDLDMPLHDADRVAFFHLRSMWPCQYRDGAALAPELKQALAEKGKVLRH